eukprot:gene17244-8805_t
MAESEEGDDCAEKLTVKYIGQKVSKVRWKPTYYGQLQESDVFVTGAWDDERNLISVWTTNENSRGEYFDNDALNGEPELLCSLVHDGSVSDMQFVTSDCFVTSSSTGNVGFYEISKDESNIQLAREWTSLHCHKNKDSCACTSITVSHSNAASVGEDGKINVLHLERKEPLRTIDNAECVAIRSVKYTQTSEIVTGGATGQLKLWDLRQPAKKPSKTMILSGDKVSLESVERHPHQPCLLVTGAADGIIGVWDLRHERYPVTLIEAHESEVWEVKFHPQSPDNLFTCSDDGSVWYWDGTSIGGTTSTAQSGERYGALPLPDVEGRDARMVNQQASSPWLFVDTNKHYLETYSLLPANSLPVNSLDIISKSLVCGTDGEAVIIVQDLPIK